MSVPWTISIPPAMACPWMAEMTGFSDDESILVERTWSEIPQDGFGKERTIVNILSKKSYGDNLYGTSRNHFGADGD